jgi:transposase-like protein
MWIGENEWGKFWLAVLNELKNRGVQDILITCVDNLAGFSQAIAACYPKAEIQKCIIHQIRNSTRYVSYKDLKKVTADLQGRDRRSRSARIGPVRRKLGDKVPADCAVLAQELGGIGDVL